MATTGSLPDGPSSGDINERLAEVAAELAAEARFKEPSAAERSSAARRTPASWPKQRGGPVRARRNRRLAAQLRKPVAGGPPVPQAPRRRVTPRRRPVTNQVGGLAVPDRGYAEPSYRGRGRSLAAVLVIILALFVVSYALRNLLGA